MTIPDIVREFEKRYAGFIATKEKREWQDQANLWLTTTLQTFEAEIREEIAGEIGEQKKGGNTTGWCNDCNGHIANEHHQMTCENYNLALKDASIIARGGKK